MFFSKIFGASLAEPRYIRRTRAYLQEARMAMLEHTIAAEYYKSSADMYAERAARLEEELRAWEEGVEQSRAAHVSRRTHARHSKPEQDADFVTLPTQPMGFDSCAWCSRCAFPWRRTALAA